MTVVMNGRSYEMVLSIVEGIGLSAQAVGLQDEINCRISSSARLKNCSNEEVGEFLVCSVGVRVGVNV